MYLASNLLMGIACVWLGLASTSTYTPFLVGRIFLGVFEAPIESIVPSTVTDLFFLHERGEKVSLYGLSVLSGNELGPVVSAFIIQSLGIRWAFYIVAMFIGLSFVTMLLAMPETKYTGVRPEILPPTLRMGEKSAQAAEHHEKLGKSDTQSVSLEDHGHIPKKTYRSTLSFWGAGDPNVNLLHAFLRPFVLVAYPTVLWSSLIYGLSLSWNVVLGATTAQLFAPP